jgi:hypothetical protein
MRTAQLGGAVGASVIIGALAVAGYYAYTQFMAPAVPPSCNAQLNSCTVNCRKTNNEAPALQACQEACQRDAAACK